MNANKREKRVYSLVARAQGTAHPVAVINSFIDLYATFADKLSPGGLEFLGKTKGDAQTPQRRTR